MAGHEAVRDQEGDGAGNVLGAADAADRRLAGIFGEDGLPLLFRQEAPQGVGRIRLAT